MEWLIYSSGNDGKAERAVHGCQYLPLVKMAPEAEILDEGKGVGEGGRFWVKFLINIDLQWEKRVDTLFDTYQKFPQNSHFYTYRWSKISVSGSRA